MKLLFVVVICTALLAAVDGKTYEFKDCIRMDVNGTVTVTARNTKTNVTETPVVVDLDTATPAITGNCSENSSVVMTVKLNNVATWVLNFTSADKVSLDQSVSFKPVDLFNDTGMNDSVTLMNKEQLVLSSSNESYECDAQQMITFTARAEGNFSFDVSQNISFMQVQAFGRPKNQSYSPAEHCQADVTTVAPTTVATTVATTPPSPTPPPKAKPQTFLVKDGKQNVCFKLVAGLQFVVEYNKTDGIMALSKLLTFSGSANVSGTCATAKVNTATMVITEGDHSLTITETRAAKASSAIQLTVNLDATNFPGAAKENTSLSFKTTTFSGSADTFYVCDSQQALRFGNTTTTTLFTNDVQLQAFNLKNGSFSGKGVRCAMDPIPSPMPPAVTPGDNTYTVSSGNITCIVFTGEISFSNVSYVMANGSSAMSKPIVIPAMNESTGNVKVNGSCDPKGDKTEQTLEIMFNSNWTLMLTFAKDAKSTMLGASDPAPYSVRDIQLTYYLMPELFPNANQTYGMRTAGQTNITTDFLKGSDGGSYKCDARQTETIGDGIQFQTDKLQYKAFNNDNTTTFNNKVSECSADDESNSIVPIAVGAALAGLVAIVLIAYLIGRRRSRRQGYESV